MATIHFFLYANDLPPLSEIAAHIPFADDANLFAARCNIDIMF